LFMIYEPALQDRNILLHSDVPIASKEKTR